MNKYSVTYTVDVEAHNILEAAYMTHELMKESKGPILEIDGYYGNGKEASFTLDLSEYTGEY